MNKAIFFDRDGTLNKDPGYVYKLEDFELYEDVISSLKRLKDYKLFIISNQSGIGRGYYEEKDMHTFNNHMLKILNKQDIKIEKIYFCPHAPDNNCNCRKPSTKYIKQAQKEFNLNLKDSWVIGDHDSDILFAKNARLKSVYLLTGHGVKHLKEARKANPDYISSNLTQAIDYILINNKNKIIERKNMENLVKKLRKENKTIATLNGTFDILHNGHKKIIHEAKKQADILIMAINSDSSVKKNKGPDRPLNNQLNRAKMLASYNDVNYVTFFNEETPIELLEIIKPNVHVNGSEYGKDCIEAPIVKKYGGKIHVVNLLPGISTSKIIKNEK